MDTISSGYADFAHLRKRMDTTSSQPIPNSSRDTIEVSPIKREPHYSPKMDDAAASQQLMDEGANAEHTNGDGAHLPQVHGIPSPIRKIRKSEFARKSSRESPFASPRKTVPASSPFPFPPTQTQRDDNEDLQTAKPLHSSAANSSGRRAAVEVPDSQTVPLATAAATSPSRSSLVVPSSVTKSRRTYSKSKQSRRFDTVREIEPEQDVDVDGDTTMDAAEATSPSHAPAKRKRLHESSTGLDDTDTMGGAVAEEIAETPAPTKRQRMAKSKQTTTARDLVGDGNGEDDLNSSEPPTTEKKKLKRIKKPTPRRSVATNIYEVPNDDPRDMSRESPLANDTDHVPRAMSHDSPLAIDADDDPQAMSRVSPPANDAGLMVVDTCASENDQDIPIRKKRGGKKKKQKEDDEAIMKEPVSSEDEFAPGASSEDGASTEKKKRKKKDKKDRTRSSTQQALRARRASGNPMRIRQSIIQPADVPSAADNALNTDRDLGHPPDLRQGGKFTEDEEELIRRAIRDYQQRKELNTSQLVDIIQWTTNDLDRSGDRRSSDRTPQETEEARESAEFWEEMKNIGLRRKKTNTLIKHIRARYHQYRSGGWTAEEDKELRALVAAHPKQWKLISTSIGDRSPQDCQNRWRDYLQCGGTRNTSTWSQEEEELLVRAVNTLAQRNEDHRAETGQPPLAEYTKKDIPWSIVSKEMGGIRSRVQITKKWVQLEKHPDRCRIKVEYKPRNEEVRSPSPASVKQKKRGRPGKNDKVDTKPSKKRRKSKMSQVVYDDSEDEPGADTWPDNLDLALDDNNQSRKSPGHTDGANNQSSASHTNHDRERAQGQEDEDITMEEGEQHEVTPEEEKEVNAPEEVEESINAQLEQSVQDDEENTAEDAVEEGVREDEEHEHVPEQEQRDAAKEEEKGSRAEEDNTTQDDEHEDDGMARVQEDDDIREEVENSDQDHEDINAPEQQQADIQDQGLDDVPGQEHNRVEDQEEDQPTVPSTPSPKKPKAVLPSTGISGVDQMLWGDKYDLIIALAERRDEYIEDIDWDEVKLPKHPWSLHTLQSALQDLIQLLRDNDKEVDLDYFPSVVDDILDFIAQNHAKELEERYDPYQEVVSEDGVRLEGPIATTPSSIEKRKKIKKRKSRDGEQPGSSLEKWKKKKKKRHSKSLAAAPDTPSS